MPSFFFALISAAFASIGARDQSLVAGLSAHLGKSKGILASALVASALTCTVMAATGIWAAQMLSPGGKLVLVAVALLLAAVELVWPYGRKPLGEPTLSLFAIGLVVALRQIWDGARLLVFAVSAATGEPFMAGLGGFCGSAAALYLGWALGPNFRRDLPLHHLRYALAGVLAIAGLSAALSAAELLN